MPIGDEVWFGTTQGAFRVDLHTKISVDLDRRLQGVRHTLRMTVWFEGITRPIVRYIDTQTGNESYVSSQAAPIRLVYRLGLAKAA